MCLIYCNNLESHSLLILFQIIFLYLYKAESKINLQLISDYVVVGSDSGRITIIEYNATKNQFERIHMETFGKSGCRRIVPGQYLAIDPKGRAVMIGKNN